MKTASPSKRIAASSRWSRRRCSCGAMRPSTDVAAYDAFVQEVVAYWRNRPAAERAGRGAAGAARPALGRDSQLHELLPGRAAVEHDSRGASHLLGAGAVDGPHGRSARASQCRRGPLPRPGRPDDAAAAQRGRAPHRLPPCDRLVGAQARAPLRATGIARTCIPRSPSGARTTRWCGRMASAPTSSTCGSCTWPRPPAKRASPTSSLTVLDQVGGFDYVTVQAQVAPPRRDGAGDPHSRAGPRRL